MDIRPLHTEQDYHDALKVISALVDADPDVALGALQRIEAAGVDCRDRLGLIERTFGFDLNGDKHMRVGFARQLRQVFARVLAVET